ncbi:uncharacterized protein LOC129761754 [Toxorhynchites rutilus septentrionalis]|uniref:uncharacterized protein LOC129761754 n=1 Tax=Toxorhynchites rutilus septentrionalis TaxID=329112 RepID=UPI00247AF5A4|nr:uncharacterized protein LOC129761754 [Toxorhynchites rutilus septentrionalis]
MTEVEKKPEAEKITGNTETETDAPKTDNEHQRKINIGNLPSDVTEQQLREHFTGHEIEKVEIYHYRKYTLALLLFKDKETATKAISEKDGSMFRERRLRIHLEYMTIRHIKRDVIVVVVDDENMTEEQLWDKIKTAAGVEPTSVLIFYPLGYVSLAKDSDKPAILEKLNAAGFNAHDVNQRDQNQHLDIWRAAKLFFRNRNRVQLLNIPNKWIEDKEEMMKNCLEGGVITEAVSNNVSQNQNASNYARIFYENEEQASKAASALNGRIFEGKRIHALHLGSALVPNYKTSVFATSLDKTITEEQVYDHFKQFGEIDFVNRRNCNDAAIICYKNADAVEKALACTTFPAPTDENKDATKEVTVKKYNGPLVLRPQAVKRKIKTNEDGQQVDPEEKSKEQQDVLKKLQAYHPIFVGNVPLNCPPLELKRYFSQHGPIKFMFSPQIVLYRTSAPHPVKTFIIYYNTRASAVNACKFLDHKFFGGHRLHVLPLRGETSFDVKKTIKMTKIPYLSEDALFKKIKPYVGKINRIVKKSRLAAYIELNDPADVEKMLKSEAADHPFPKGKMELIKTPVNVRLYNENDSRVLGGIAKIISKNPDMLKKTPISAQGPMNKRPRLSGPGFNQGPGGFNTNNNLNNPQAIQDLLRLAFMSGKNVGESLASNQTSFNAPDPPIANSNNFGDGGFGNRNNRNNQGGQNFRGQGRNQNQNNRGNANNNSFGTNNAGTNIQTSPGNNQNRGGQNMMNRGNQQNNQNPRVSNDGGNNMNQNRNNLNNQSQGNRMQPNKPGGGNNMNLNNRNQGGGNMNRNQTQPRNQNNRNNNNFDNDSSFGGGNNNFGGNNRNNFANDNFSNDSFSSNRNDNFSNDNFSGNNRNFGGNNRNQNDSFSNSFGSGNNNGGGGGGRFNNDSQFGNNNFNRNQNNRFDDNDNNFGNNSKGNNSFNPNRQNKPFNNSNNSQGIGGGGMSFGEFSSNSNRGGFGGGNSSNFGSGNAGGGNKWNNSNSQQSNTGSRLAGSIFSRRF